VGSEIQNVLGTFLESKITWKAVLTESEGLSHAEISQACMDAIKQTILSEKETVNMTLLRQMLNERQGANAGRKG